MAYDPSDLRLPGWLVRFLDALIELRIPIGAGWLVGFTRPGVVFTAALLGVWAAALYSGNNLLYLCGAMISAICLAAIASAVRLLRRFPDPAGMMPVLQAGSVTVLRKRIGFTTASPAVVAIEWEDVGGCIRLSGRCEAGIVQLGGRIRPQQRGIYPCLSLKLTTAAPLGLFTLTRKRAAGGETVVMPEPLAWHPAMRQGNATTGQVYSAGDEWLDLRSYLPGDPLSRVHWRKASGSVSDWKVKRFASAQAVAEGRRLRVDLRLPPGSDMAAFERLLGRVWFWVMEQGQSGSLVLGQHCFDLAEMQGDQGLMRALAAAEPELKPAAGEGGMLLAVGDE